MSCYAAGSAAEHRPSGVSENGQFLEIHMQKCGWTSCDPSCAASPAGVFCSCRESRGDAPKRSVLSCVFPKGMKRGSGPQPCSEGQGCGQIALGDSNIGRCDLRFRSCKQVAFRGINSRVLPLRIEGISPRVLPLRTIGGRLSPNRREFPDNRHGSVRRWPPGSSFPR